MRAEAKALLAANPGLRVLRDEARRVKASWGLETLRGRLSELSGEGGSARLTAAIALVLEAQTKGEDVVWLTTTPSSFYPPDVAAAGVDLETLVLIRHKKVRSVLSAAAHVARSGAFGLLVIDLGSEPWVPLPAQTLLVGHAQRHDLVILFLTHKKREAPSVGSLIALRAEALRSKGDDKSFYYRIEVLKDKRCGPGLGVRERCIEPDGLY